MGLTLVLNICDICEVSRSRVTEGGLLDSACIVKITSSDTARLI